MKKVLIFTNLLFLTSTIVLGLRCCKEKDQETTQTQSCSTCTDYSSVKFEGLNATVAMNMSNNYKNNQLATINAPNNIPGGDARSVWFPLDTIKKFIWEIEKANCTKNCTGKAYGVRVYYAAYPNQVIMNDAVHARHLGNLPQTFEMHHTIFMVPTYTDAASGGPVDFDPWHLGNNCTPLPFAALRSPKMLNENSLILAPKNYNQPLNVTQTNSGAGSTTATVQNHGTLCPPYCTPPTGTAF